MPSTPRTTSPPVHEGMSLEIGGILYWIDAVHGQDHTTGTADVSLYACTGPHERHGYRTQLTQGELRAACAHERCDHITGRCELYPRLQDFLADRRTAE